MVQWAIIVLAQQFLSMQVLPLSVSLYADQSADKRNKKTPYGKNPYGVFLFFSFSDTNSGLVRRNDQTGVNNFSDIGLKILVFT